MLIIMYLSATHCYFNRGRERRKRERKGQRCGEKGEKNKEEGQSERI